MPSAAVLTLAPEADEDLPADGRRLRSHASRRKIVLAMMELVQSGVMEPGAEMVADRAGVGLRSVFRHFNDMESLRREMNEIVSGELKGLIEKPFVGSTWRERLTELADRRAEGFDKVMAFRRAGNLQTHRSAFLKANNARLNAFLREALRSVLSPELAKDEPLFEALDLVLCFESWIRLRHDQGLDAEAARAAQERIVSALVD